MGMRQSRHREVACLPSAKPTAQELAVYFTWQKNHSPQEAPPLCRADILTAGIYDFLQGKRKCIAFISLTAALHLACFLFS